MVFTSSFTPPAAGQSQKYRATITTSGFEDVPKLEFTLTRELCHHENMAWTQVDSSSHKGTCLDCSEEVTAAHTFDENGNCVCGATLAVTLTNAEGLIYKGDEHKPGVSVAVNDKTLTENTDYTVSYTGNINAGENTATVTVTGSHKDLLHRQGHAHDHMGQHDPGADLHRRSSGDYRPHGDVGEQ